MVVSIFFIQIGKMIHGNYGVSQLIYQIKFSEGSENSFIYDPNTNIISFISENSIKNF